MTRALVTGGCGFIGSALVRFLLDCGHEVTVLDDFSTGRNFDYRVSKYVPHDIVDQLPDLPPMDVCYHLAAVSRIGTSLTHPARCRAVNVTGTERVIQWCDQHGTKLVFASTSCCAGDINLNPYAHTKYIGEQHVRQYGGAIARLFNVYGPGEPESGPSSTVVARFLKARRDGTPLVVHGDGSQRRDFVHVKDAVTALATLGDRSNPGETYDVGTGDNYSIFGVARLIAGPLGEIQYAPLPPGQMTETRADVSAMWGLGWRAYRTLPEYIAAVLTPRPVEVQ